MGLKESEISKSECAFRKGYAAARGSPEEVGAGVGLGVGGGVGLGVGGVEVGPAVGPAVGLVQAPGFVPSFT